MRILEAILAGERDPEALATLCSTRIKALWQTVAKACTATGARSCRLRWPWNSYRFAQAKSPSAMNASANTWHNLKLCRVGHPACELKGELHRTAG